MTEATYADHSKSAPQITSADGAKTWLTRGANFVVAVSEVKAGARLERADNADEYWVLLREVGATIEAGGQKIEADPQSLTVVPPGASVVIAKRDGVVARVFSTRAEDLAAKSVNAAAYANGAPECAPLKPWPAPKDGYKLRNYKPLDIDMPDTNMRVFRSSNLMVNVMTKRTAPRPLNAMSPHSHNDFEQGSLLLEGDYIHHMRWPWGPDANQWRADEAAEVSSPSIAVIPAKVIHTSRNVGPKTSWLIDVFAPPRMDFSKKPGFVCNEADYPMPES